MIQDFKFAFRQLVKSPVFSAIAILTLALAIGTNSAIFALINGVILRPVLSAILYQVADPFALALSSLMLAGSAFLACFLPARRATQVNPITALRTE